YRAAATPIWDMEIHAAWILTPAVALRSRRDRALTLRQVTWQVHPILQDSADFDDPAFDGAMKEKVAPAPAVPGDMERAEARHHVVARSWIQAHRGHFARSPMASTRVSR